jgi:succinate dehydrogenase/fumarate reductase cytochrome b subunit
MFLAVKLLTVHLYHQNQTSQSKSTMKKFITNSNPFVLLVIPVLFAMIMGVSYQFKAKTNFAAIDGSYKQSTSLFIKSVTLIKTVCSVGKEKAW